MDNSDPVATDNGQHGLVMIRIHLTSTSDDSELELIGKRIRQRIHESRRGVLIDCRRLIDVDRRTLDLLMQCQRSAVAERKRFALVSVQPGLRDQIEDNQSDYPLDCFGMPTAKSKRPRSGVVPLGQRLKAMILAPIGWFLRDKPLTTDPLKNSRTRNLPWMRWAKLVIIPTVVTLPVLYAISWYLDQSNPASVAIKTFEPTGSDVRVVVRGLVEGFSAGKRVIMPGTIVTAWPEEPNPRASDSPRQAAVGAKATLTSWTTRTDQRGMFELIIPPEHSAELTSLVIAVMAMSHPVENAKGVVTMISSSRQPDDLGDQITKVFRVDVREQLDSRLQILLGNHETTPP